MSLRDTLITEIKKEAANTEKMLERIPADQFAWRPHQKSNTLKGLSTHIASLAGMTGLIVNSEYLDFAEGTLKQPEINSTKDLLDVFKEGTQNSIQALEAADEDALKANWVMRSGDYLIMEGPKAEIIRTMGMNHVYHHRAQLGVYLRLLNIPIPGMYGPSADDMAASK